MMNINYFGEINPSNLDEYYDCKIVHNGLPLHFDLNFKEKEINSEELIRVNGFLENLDVKLPEVMALIFQDYDLGDESTVREYVEHHLEEFSEEELFALFAIKNANNVNVTKELALSKLAIKRIGFYPHDADSFAIVDVSFGDNFTNYLIVLYFDKALNFSFITTES